MSRQEIGHPRLHPASYFHAGNTGQVGVHVAHGLQRTAITLRLRNHLFQIAQEMQASGRDLHEESELGGVGLFCFDVSVAGIGSRAIVNFGGLRLIKRHAELDTHARARAHARRHATHAPSFRPFRCYHASFTLHGSRGCMLLRLLNN
jgi:hypothetical protein